MKAIKHQWLLLLLLLCGGAAWSQHFLKDLMERRDLNIREVERRADGYFLTNGTGRGSGYKQFQRWLYERKFHLDGNGFYIDPVTEMNRYNDAAGTMASVNATSNSVWTELGPKQWNRTSGWNPGVGRLSAFAMLPANESIIYVGSPGGGIWKTVNAGSTWTPLTDGNNAWMSIFALEIDPLNANTVYAGTEAGQVLKSTDAGASWTAVGSFGGNVRRILIHPANSAIVFAAAGNGIWRSTNGGTTWAQVHTGFKEDMEFKPGDPNIMYATGNDVYRSTDNGLTWAAVGTVQGITNNGRCLVSVTPADPNVVYVVQANGSEFGRLYRSANSGASFVTTVTGNAATGTNYFGYSANGTQTGGQAWYDMGMCVSRTNANEVHIAGIICWESLNGGASFVANTEWFLPNTLGYNHADVHGLFWVNNNIYSISDGGLYRSSDFGDNWTDLSTGLGIRQFYRMANSRTDASVITGGAQDNGSSVLTATGWRDWLGADGMEGLVSPTNANNLWGTYQGGGLYKSTDQGASANFVSTGASGPWVTDLAIDPVNENTVYGGWFGGVRRTTDGGSTWTNISSAFFTNATNDLTVAPSNGQVIYASVGGTIWVTTNGGTNWTARTSPGGYVNDLCVSPSNPNKIWVAAGTTIHVSTDGGATFTNISGSLPAITARSVVVDNSADEGVYAGMNIGVYFRSNSNTTWANCTGNLPLVAINELEIQQTAGKLRVATYGRGIWESALVQTSCGTPASLTVTGVNNNSASVSWGSVSGAVSYTLEYKTASSATWLPVVTFSGNAWTISGLNSGTAYNWRVRANCASTSSAFVQSSFTTTGYCGSSGTNTAEWIDFFSIGTISRTSGAEPGGYVNTGLSTTLAIGSNVPVQISAGYPGAGFDEYWVIYIDYNRDGDFADPGEQAWGPGLTLGSIPGIWGSSFNIPLTVTPGSTRLRLVMKRAPNTGPACGDYTDGETEDYTVTLVSNHCASNGTNGAEWIDYFNIGSISRTSGAEPGGYVNTGLGTNLDIGSTVPLQISAGYSGAGYDQYMSIFIDFNNDGDFTDPGENPWLGYILGAYPTTWYSSLTIPATATPGTVRMRLITQRYPSVPAPCGSYANGETEDYYVTLVPGACSSKGSNGSEWIDYFNLGSISRTSGAEPGGYVNTGLSTNLNIGAPASIQISAGYSGAGFDQYFALYIDYNKDGDFSDPGENTWLGYILGAYPTTWYSSFNVPSTATPGVTRMRLIMSRYPSVAPSCGSFVNGETEDYLVNLLPNPGRFGGQEVILNPPGPGALEAIKVDPATLKAIAPAATAETVRVYPNPAKDMVTISLPAFTGTTELRVMDVSQHVVMRRRVDNETNVRLDIASLAPGTYIVQVVQGGKTAATARFVKG